jgi:tetrahydromethanopterin S-methyltransferase subunit G
VKTEEKIDRIVEKLDQIDGRIDNIDVTLVKQAGQLEHHIYRTDLAEKHLRTLESDLKPVQKHVEMVNGFLKVVGGIAVLMGMFKAGIEILNFFS